MSKSQTTIGMPLAHEDVGPEPGDLIGRRYTLRKRIGEGGMGEVWEAAEVHVIRLVALKLLRASHSDTTAVRRFIREGHLMIGFSHPHVVPLLDVGWDGGRPYLVMSLEDGEDLGVTLGWRGLLSVREVVSWLRGPASGLDALHAAGLVHRDLKPENLFVRLDGERTPHISILDFGLATLSDPSVARLTREGMICGTPEYMSPEQARGQRAQAGSDLYALAVIAYELLTGALPFEADSPMDLLVAKCREVAPSLSASGFEASPQLEAVFSRALDGDPARRFATATAFLDALEECQDRDGHAGVEERDSEPRARGTADTLEAPDTSPPARIMARSASLQVVPAVEDRSGVRHRVRERETASSIPTSRVSASRLAAMAVIGVAAVVCAALFAALS